MSSRALPQWPFSIRTKLLVAVMLVVLIPLVGTALYGNWFTGNVIKEEVIRSTHDDLQRQAQQIETYLDSVTDNEIYLAHLNSLQHYLDAAQKGDSQGAESWRRQLEQDFFIFSSSHHAFYQVRYLDANGMEIVRVDRRGGGAIIIPRDHLQDKSDRYYFIEGRQLAPGEIYISPLDLNREHDQLEEPLHPVIRYVTPVYLDDAFVGEIVVNLEGESVLAPVIQRNTKGVLAMVDQDGYYLVHPDPSQRWGGPHDLNTGISARRLYPEKAAMILSGQEGDVVTDGEIIIYSPIYYLQSHPERFWVLMQAEPVNQLLAPLFDFRLTAGLILIFAILVAFLMTLALAREFTQPLLTLEQGVKRVAQGDFSGRLEVKSRDEFGQLTVSFNEMAEMIRGYLEQMDRLQSLGLKISSHVEREEILSLVISTIHELLPIEEEIIYCIEGNGGSSPPRIVAKSPGETAPDRKPLNTELFNRAQQLSVGEIITHQDEGQVLYYAPLRISTRRQAMVELVGKKHVSLDPWHGKLLSSLMAQGSIALENADLYQRLARNRAQLRQLVDELMTAQEEERRMVAYDIHDGLLQYLVATRLLLRNYAGLLEQDPDAAHSLLADGMTQLATAINEGRRIIEGMRPTLLDDLGLEAAVSEMAQALARRAGWQFSLEVDLGDTPIPPNIEITAFRIVQEALTNAYKYAQGQRVHVRLSVQQDVLTLLVQDWGQGFVLEEVDARLGHVGLVAMQERARLVGGVCTIDSQPGAGARVIVRLPLTQEIGALVEDDEDSRDRC